MTARTLLVPVLIAGAGAVLAPSMAHAEGSDPHAKATFQYAIHTGAAKATLRVRYRCSEGEALWVSAKQSASGAVESQLRKEGASKQAASWWQSHRNSFVCNGASHTASFTIDKVEPGSKGALKRGYAWVQFCVTQGREDLILSKSGWVKVR